MPLQPALSLSVRVRRRGLESKTVDVSVRASAAAGLSGEDCSGESRSWSGETADIESETFVIALLQLLALMPQIHLTSVATSKGQQSFGDRAKPRDRPGPGPGQG